MTLFIDERIDYALKTWRYFCQEYRKDSNLITNRITLFRLLVGLLPGPLYCIFPDIEWVLALSIVLFIIVAITDAIDGYVARHYNMVTELGRMLDPFTDKVFAIVTLIALSVANSRNLPVLIFTIVIFVREILLFIFLYLASNREEDVKVNRSGKWKTVLVSVTIGMLFLPADGLIFRHLVLFLGCNLSTMSAIWYEVTKYSIGASYIIIAWSTYEYWREYSKKRRERILRQAVK